MSALSQNSWDLTHKRMRDLIESRILNKELQTARTSPVLSSAAQTNFRRVLGD